ncbi:unnamed protein product [Choristocarpus tenellus]
MHDGRGRLDAAAPLMLHTSLPKMVVCRSLLVSDSVCVRDRTFPSTTRSLRMSMSLQAEVWSCQFLIPNPLLHPPTPQPFVPTLKPQQCHYLS